MPMLRVMRSLTSDFSWGMASVAIEFLLVLAAIVGLYIISAEAVKRMFYQHASHF